VVHEYILTIQYMITTRLQPVARILFVWCKHANESNAGFHSSYMNDIALHQGHQGRSTNHGATDDTA